MKKFFVFCFVVPCLLLSANTRAGEGETIRRNYIRLLLSDSRTETLNASLFSMPKELWYSDQVVVELMEHYPPERQEVASLLSKLRPDGSWSDIDYDNRDRSGWKPAKHVARIGLLAKIYKSPGTEWYGADTIERTIHKALDCWFRKGLVCSNWWYNQIGIPKSLGSALILFEDKLTPEEKSNGLKLMNKSKFGMTGQNKVWLAGNILVRALLENNLPLVKMARDTILSEVKTGNREGIMPDYSFHQHGPQQQFGNYGSAFLSSMAFWATLLKNTPMAFDQPRLDILRQFITEGYGRILWRGYMDVNALGRQFFRNAQRHKALSVGFSSAWLAAADTLHADSYRQLTEGNFVPGRYSGEPLGFYHFRMSDCTVYRRPDWMASVKLSSPRTIGAEALNGDNRKGYYLADGATYIYTDGDEYDNIFPCWDWRKLPGVTAYQTNAPLKQLTGEGYHNQSSFAGSAGNDSTGITAIHFDRERLTARKAWVFTPRFVLCLGAAVSSDSSCVVTTSIEQQVQKADLLQLRNNRWEPFASCRFDGQEERFFHHHTGYIIPGKQNGGVSAVLRKGDWKAIMDTYPAGMTEEKKVFSLWIDHGKSPRDGSYQYVVLPASSADEVKAFDMNSIRVTHNDANLQSVWLPADQTCYVAAYRPADGTIAPGIHLKTDQPLLLVIKLQHNRFEIAVSDPTQELSKVTVTINNRTQAVALPSGDRKGSSVMIFL